MSLLSQSDLPDVGCGYKPVIGCMSQAALCLSACPACYCFLLFLPCYRKYHLHPSSQSNAEMGKVKVNSWIVQSHSRHFFSLLFSLVFSFAGNYLFNDPDCLPTCKFSTNTRSAPTLFCSGIPPRPWHKENGCNQTILWC